MDIGNYYLEKVTLINCMGIVNYYLGKVTLLYGYM